MISAPISNRYFVITGGPGTGKTTLLDALCAKKFPCIPEVARAIIKAQIDADGDALPWKDRKRYTQLMLTESVRSYQQVNARYAAGEVVFFDRGIADTLCYAEMIGLEISEDMEQAVIRYPYHRTVFLLPPWLAIYHTDSERKQTWEEAQFTYEMMKKTYHKYGYHVVEVPKAPVTERVEFVLKAIK